MNFEMDKIVFNRDEIQKIIPHRDPILLLDTVHELELGKRIFTSRYLSLDEPIFRGHFPGDPIYPGVYFVEAIAQSGAILAFRTRFNLGIVDKISDLGVLTAIQEVRFRQAGKPGETVCYEVVLEKMRSQFVWLSGTGYINNKIALQCKLSLAIGQTHRGA